ncbi:LuxR C-terminal-related transcriptional regulator [Nocardioides sp. CCNWLW239]|uniref:LuxR C-terminal-related transcriptional regulator n=1 Tax=Nocardioides sp. CCNWLW239 TaxID=3128902 RepID=UPI003017D6A2
MHDGTTGVDVTVVRDRVIDRLRGLEPGEVAWLDGPFGSGRTSAVRQWLSAESHTARWHPSAPGHADHERSAPDVIVLDGGTAETVEAAIESLAARPQARFVVIASGEWPKALRAAGIRPSTVITGRTLRFTREEIHALGRHRAIDLADGDLERIVETTGGYPLVVDAVIHQIAISGQTDDDVLATGCDRAVDVISRRASTGKISRGLWENFLVAAGAEDLTPAAMDVLDGSGPDGPFALRAMLDAQILGPSSRRPMSFGFPPPLRRAFRRRLSIDVASARQLELIGAAVAVLRGHGLVADAISVASDPALRPLLLDLLRDEWMRLADVPASVVLELLSASSATDLSAELLVAQARALIDIAQLGRSVPVAPRDRQVAQRLLDRAERAVEEESRGSSSAEDVLAVITSLRAAEDRSAGRIEDGYATLQACLDRPPTNELAAAIVRLQAGLTAYACERVEEALTHFIDAGADATIGGDPRMAALAADLEELMHWIVDDTAAWWRHISLGPDTLPDRGTAISPTLGIARAIHTVDMTALQTLLSQPGLAIDDPLAVSLLDLQGRIIAHQVLQNSRIAAQELDLADAALRGRRLSTMEAYNIILARAELLLDAGRPEQAMAVLDAAPPSIDPINDALVRAHVQLALGDYAAVVERLPAVLEPVGGDRGRFAVMAHLLLFLAYRQLDDEEAADRCLEIALVTSGRNRLVWPFVRMGLDELRTIIDRAAELTLDDLSVAHVVRLQSVWDKLNVLRAPVNLTDRERVILEHLAGKASVRRIAADLHVSANTVKTQTQSLYRKLGVSSREGAVNAAIRRGLIPARSSATGGPHRPPG